jgi:hypothetical protein
VTVIFTTNKSCTHRIVVAIRVGFHVPDDLVAEQLRDLGRLKDETLDVAWDESAKLYD